MTWQSAMYAHSLKSYRSRSRWRRPSHATTRRRQGRMPVRASIRGSGRGRAARVGAEPWRSVPRRRAMLHGRHDGPVRGQREHRRRAREQRRMAQQHAVAALVAVRIRVVRHRRVMVIRRVLAGGLRARHRHGRGQRARDRRRNHEQPHGGQGQPCNKTPWCVAPDQLRSRPEKPGLGSRDDRTPRCSCTDTPCCDMTSRSARHLGIHAAAAVAWLAAPLRLVARWASTNRS